MQTQRATSHDAITDLNFFRAKRTHKCTYFFFVHVHEPVAHVEEHVDPLVRILTEMWRVREVDPRDALVLPHSAKTGLIVEQTQLLYYVVHDQVDVDLRFVAHALLVRLAELADLTDVESLIWVQLEHAHYDSSQLGRVLLTQRRVLALCDPLEELVQRQVFFIILSERTAQLANLVGNAAQRPYIGLPVVAFTLKDFGTHVERRSYSRKCLESLTTQLPRQTEITDFEGAVIIDKDVSWL